jgi:hypothetical protein
VAAARPFVALPECFSKLTHARGNGVPGEVFSRMTPFIAATRKIIPIKVVSLEILSVSRIDSLTY